MTNILDTMEPDAHIFPSDLEIFKSSETTATAYSVAVGNPDERSTPLYSRETVERLLAEHREQVLLEALSVEPTDRMITSGMMALLKCSHSDLESYSPRLYVEYEDDVKRVAVAILGELRSMAEGGK